MFLNTMPPLAALRLRRGLPPGLAWLGVFLPALAYLLATRAAGRGAAAGDVVARYVVLTDATSCPAVAALLPLGRRACDGAYDAEGAPLRQWELLHPLVAVERRGLATVSGTVWRHDAELGRGYLLLASSSSSSSSSAAAAATGAPGGRVWRWETGGGPIAIGRTLHLEAAGCRSGAYKDCTAPAATADGTGTDTDRGPGGMAVDFHGKEHFTEGHLVVSEWGEGRIVRLEESGARTPLVLYVPDVCYNATATAAMRRVERPTGLQFAPSGDLYIVDHYRECRRSSLLVLRDVVHVPAVASLAESRAAHYNWTHQWKLPELVLTREKLGGLALSHDYRSILVTARDGERIALLQVPLPDEDAVDREDEPVAAGAAEPVIVLRMDGHATCDEPGSIAIDQNGHIYWAIDDTIFVIGPDHRVLAEIVTGMRIQSLTLGGDSFLYAATLDSLLRMPVRFGPSKVPTDRVRKRAAIKAE